MQSLGMDANSQSPILQKDPGGFLHQSLFHWRAPSSGSGLFLQPCSLLSVFFKGFVGYAAHAFPKCVLSTQAPGLQPESGTGSPSLWDWQSFELPDISEKAGQASSLPLIDEELRQEDGENLTKLLMIQDYFRKETKKLSLNIRLGPSPSLPIATLPHHPLLPNLEFLPTWDVSSWSPEPADTAPHISVASQAFPCHFISLQWWLLQSQPSDSLLAKTRQLSLTSCPW